MGGGRTGAQARGGPGIADDTYESAGRSGGGGDYDRINQGGTSGGLGVDDRYGDSATVSTCSPSRHACTNWTRVGVVLRLLEPVLSSVWVLAALGKHNDNGECHGS